MLVKNSNNSGFVSPSKIICNHKGEKGICSTPVAEFTRNGDLIVRNRHHKEQHVAVIPIADLVALLFNTSGSRVFINGSPLSVTGSGLRVELRPEGTPYDKKTSSPTWRLSLAG